MKSRPRTAPKQGKALEQVVAWIQKSLHRNAVVSHDDTIPDKDTGEPRQIDVSIRLSSGQEELLVIVEVRDRTAKVDATYVEQVISKRASVKADAAFIVSKSGFTAPAVKKAGLHGIRTFTLDEASEADWSGWISARTMGVFERKFAPTAVLLARKGTEQVIDLSETAVAAFRADPTSKVVLTGDAQPFISLPDLTSNVVNYFVNKGLVEAPDDGTRVTRSMLFQGGLEPPLFVEASSGRLEEIGWVRVDAELWWEMVNYPLTLRRYRKATEDEVASHAEIMEAEVVLSGKKVTFQLLAETDGSGVKGGTLLSLRHVVAESE